MGRTGLISITKSLQVLDAEEDAVESNLSALIWRFRMNNKLNNIPPKMKNSSNVGHPTGTYWIKGWQAGGMLLS